MKIYASTEQSESDERYILTELEQLGKLKRKVREMSHPFDIFFGESPDNAWGTVTQVGNNELEFNEYYIENMIEVEIEIT